MNWWDCAFWGSFWGRFESVFVGVFVGVFVSIFVGVFGVFGGQARNPKSFHGGYLWNFRGFFRFFAGAF